MPSPKRTFLFLQGLASPFFADLAKALQRRGHEVRRINISFGDALFWRLPATSYRGSLANWRKFLTDFLSDEAVTDIVLFGDCRPYHRVAISLAAHRRVQVHVVEEGYLRPHWITVERGGVNGYSSLPRDPKTIKALAADLPPAPERTFAGSFPRRAIWDVTYNLANILGRPAYPRYRRHRPNHVLVEYAGWLKRIGRRKRLDREAVAAAERVLAHPGGFFLVPLQLDSDYQIRVHSRFAALDEFLNEVFASFARHAPGECRLLVKVHPLDNGLVDRRAQVAELARRHGIGDRVTYIDGGYLPTLLLKARGVVVVNSTVGMSSIEALTPTIALGTAIYDLPGLSYQDGLHRFWTEPTRPDPELVQAFRTLVVHRTQVNGGFFCREGVAMAVQGAAERMESVAPLLHYYPTANQVSGPAAGPLFGRPQPAE
jgi:capsular polysaccharide export protein